MDKENVAGGGGRKYEVCTHRNFSLAIQKNLVSMLAWLVRY